MSKLYIIATPIGNMGDISPRAKELLLTAKILFCEDTRIAEKLLAILQRENNNNEDVDTEAITLKNRRLGDQQLISYHKFNERHTLQDAIHRIQAIGDGHAALISDAGTPTISDPGQLLVEACHQNNIRISIVPGPSAFISAVALSGFAFDKLQFIGFLPKQADERKSALYEALKYDGVTAAYESPMRIYESLEIIKELDPCRSIAIIRELTKKFEETVVLPITEMIDYFRQRHESDSIKGECVIVIDKPSKKSACSLSEDDQKKLLVQEVLALKEKQAISLSEACLLVAKAHGVKKGELYKSCLHILS